jgi:dihydroorotase
MANRYCQEIKKHIGDSLFNPLMTLYFNDSLDSDELKKVRDSDNIIGIKLYPAGVTTNSKDGVSDFKNCLPIFLPVIGSRKLAHQKIGCFSTYY